MSDVEIRTRQGCRNEFIYPETMTCREKLKRRAVSELSRFMVFDITDDEMDDVEREIGYAANQFINEADRYHKATTGLGFYYYDILILYYFRRCLRIVDDFLFTPPDEIKEGFFKNLNKAVEELREDGLLP